MKIKFVVILSLVMHLLYKIIFIYLQSIYLSIYLFIYIYNLTLIFQCNEAWNLLFTFNIPSLIKSFRNNSYYRLLLACLFVNDFKWIITSKASVIISLVILQCT
jgi:hypothetical protein